MATGGSNHRHRTPALTFNRREIMQKKELIHIHALLYQVRQYVTENENIPVEMHSTYDALDVRPSSIHKQKQNHYEAITTLGGSIERSLEQADTDKPHSQ